MDVAGRYDRLGAGYSRLSALLDRTAVNRMRADALALATGEVLEVAVGTGANLRHYPAASRVVGLDFAPRALAAASVRAGALDLRWCPVAADAERLPLPDASVDTVVCTLAGCTFRRPAVVFGEMRRVLRPGGQALFVEHVRPAARTGRAALRVLTPLTVAALGCHPDRDTLHTIGAAGFTTEVLDRALRGLFLSVRAVPA